MEKDVVSLSWELYEKTGEPGFYLMYRALYGESERERKKRELREKLR